MAKQLERRYVTADVEVRSKGNKAYIEGHAAVFNKLSENLGGFVERVLPGAFTVTIKESDIRALFNHDPIYVLGRNTAKTLELAEDDSGLYYRTIAPDTQYSRDLIGLIERGDITGSSFSFFKVEDHWGTTDQDFPRRDLVAVQAVDVGPVTFPAYLDTDSGVVRAAALEGLAKRSGLNVVDLADPDSIRAAIKGQPAERSGVKASLKRDALEEALREAHGGTDISIWVRDYDDNTVWFERWDGSEETTYQQSYSLDNDKVALDGELTEVQVKVEYTPVERQLKDNSEEARKAWYTAELERLSKIGSEA